MKCKYVEWYQTKPCGAETECAICPEHQQRKCSGCKKQATRECSYTGQFVCGSPLCDDCTWTDGDSTKGLGWGFIGHTHQPKTTTHGGSDE